LYKYYNERKIKIVKEYFEEEGASLVLRQDAE